MSDRWIQVSKNILDQMEKLKETEGKDRLELVSSMRFAIRALEMSLAGWKGWVNNPDVMTKFTEEELRRMNKKLSEFTQSFLKYDMKVTAMGAQKGLKAAKKVRKKELKRRTPYVA
jgi:hypothetical protein